MKRSILALLFAVFFLAFGTAFAQSKLCCLKGAVPCVCGCEKGNKCDCKADCLKDGKCPCQQKACDCTGKKQ